MNKANTPPAKKKKVSLYAETITIHPRAVKGMFRSAKTWLMFVLLAIFHIAPFIRWDRGPNAPSQAILGDIQAGRGYFFFLEIWPQEVYYLTGILLLAAIVLFFMSALAGRVWCGFLCFQTVYTDMFVMVERLIVGDRNASMAMDRSGFTAQRIVKRGLVHTVWILISLSCGVGFTLYFGDVYEMLREIFTLQAGVWTYTTIIVVSGCCYLLAGFAREQVCLYMCPYSRFQSSMIDEHTKTIAYEEWRGEPRAPARKGEDFSNRGHCIDCKLCVTSCPTGVDIREGLQMGCIGCGLCIDACNSMMERFDLPKNLISYDSLHNIEARANKTQPDTKVVRPRTWVYSAIIVAVTIGMIFALSNRSTLESNILHERSPLYVQLSDGSIRNGYTFKVLNMERDVRDLSFTVHGVEGATISVVGGEDNAKEVTLNVAGDDVSTFRIYVSAPEANVASTKVPMYFQLTDKATGVVVSTETIFAGPGR